MDANTKMSLSYDITFESFISTLRTLVTNADKVNLSLPPNQTTNMILRISSQFLSLNQHANECTRHFLINELLPKVELSPVKQLFLNLLNEYPPNYQLLTLLTRITTRWRCISLRTLMIICRAPCFEISREIFEPRNA